MGRVSSTPERRVTSINEAERDDLEFIRDELHEEYDRQPGKVTW